MAFFWDGEWRRDPFKWLISDLQGMKRSRSLNHLVNIHKNHQKFDFNQAETSCFSTDIAKKRRYSGVFGAILLYCPGRSWQGGQKNTDRSLWPWWNPWNQWIIDDWVVATQIFFMFTPNLGEDEPILTSIFFKGVGKKPPTRWVYIVTTSVCTTKTSNCYLYIVFWEGSNHSTTGIVKRQ